MYISGHFNKSRPEALHALMTAHPLGILVTKGGEGLDADHLPFEFDPASGPPARCALTSRAPIRCGSLWSTVTTGCW